MIPQTTNANGNRQKQKPTTTATDLTIYGKVPPQATELEKAILGTALLNKHDAETAIELLRPECFYHDVHQRVFRAMLSLTNKNMPVEMLTVVEELKRMGELETVGGPFIIAKLTDNTTSGIESYCKIVLEKFMQREVIRMCGDILNEAYEDSTDVFDTLDHAEKELTAIVNNVSRGEVQMPGNIVVGIIERVDMLRNKPDYLTGVPTGFKQINDLTNGWQNTDLIIVAARPSVGKTALALNLARNAMVSEKQIPTAFFSLEMSSQQLMQRMISCEGQIPLKNIISGKFDNEDQYKQFLHASGKVAEMPFFIDDTAALNIMEFRSKARKLVRKQKVGLIIIDYLQLMNGMRHDKDNKNREGEISYISRSLKAVAKELNVPVIALSQLSRAVESRAGGKHQLSDLRESGAIEQDADMVMFLSRPSYQQNEKEVDPELQHDLDVDCKKHRMGSLFTQALKIDLSIQRIFGLRDWETYQSNFQKDSRFTPPSRFIPVSKSRYNTFDDAPF
jgi:replicative DNA helicase